MRHPLATGRHASLGYAGHPPVLWLDTGEELSAAITTEVREFAAAGLADGLCVVAARVGEG